jgi:hypothetical protein
MTEEADPFLRRPALSAETRKAKEKPHHLAYPTYKKPTSKGADRHSGSIRYKAYRLASNTRKERGENNGIAI